MLVNSFNAYIEEKGIRAISYRLKQHRFTPQFLDVLVDSLNPDLYLGIECKSISVDKGANALYFSQHFTVDKKGIHQIERISEYLNKSGRLGFLAVELRLGTRKRREAYMGWRMYLYRPEVTSRVEFSKSKSALVCLKYSRKASNT
jgi:hypothetical protein